MAALDVQDKVMLGRYIVGASQNADERAKLLNPDEAKHLLAKHGVKAVGDQDQVIFHADGKQVTHLILPHPEDIQSALDLVQAKQFPYHGDYVKNPLTDANLNTDFLLALYFRVGEYVVGRCKG